MKNNVLLFALSANKNLTKEVGEKLSLPIGEVEINHFADREIMVRSLTPVRGKTVYVIQSTCAPGAENLIELLLFIDGIKRANAKEINVIIPYFGYSRQDRIAKPGEPISAKLISNLLTTAGVNRIISIELHTSQIQGFFSCPVDDLSSIKLFGNFFNQFLKDNSIPSNKVSIVSPDHGSINRARDLATLIPNSSLVIVDKRRPEVNKAEVINIVGDVKGQCCIILDDIIDTAGTAIASSKMLYSKGAKDVFFAATHAVLSKDSINKIKKAGIKHIVVTNTIEREKDDMIHVISVADMIAKVIDQTENGLPIDDFWVY